MLKQGYQLDGSSSELPGWYTNQENKMSNIIGSYVNTILNAKLRIATADDNNGAITGTVTVGSTEIPINGTWNASTVAPNGILSFSGSIPQIILGGAGQTDNFGQFNFVSLGFSIAQKDNDTMSVAGKFVRA
jgi:hypothetical protein